MGITETIVRFDKVSIEEYNRTMTFKAKLFKLGNSRAVYIPKDVYTELKDGEVYTFDVIIDGEEKKEVITKPVITENTGKKFVFDIKTATNKWV